MVFVARLHVTPEYGRPVQPHSNQYLAAHQGSQHKNPSVQASLDMDASGRRGRKVRYRMFDTRSEPAKIVYPGIGDVACGAHLHGQDISTAGTGARGHFCSLRLVNPHGIVRLAGVRRSNPQHIPHHGYNMALFRPDLWLTRDRRFSLVPLEDFLKLEQKRPHIGHPYFV